MEFSIEAQRPSREHFAAPRDGGQDVSFPLRPGRPTCGRCDVGRLDWPSRPPRQRGGARPGGCVQRAETRTAKARRGGLPDVRNGRRRGPTGRVCPPRGLRAPTALARPSAPLLSLRRLDLLRPGNHGGRSNRGRGAWTTPANRHLIATCCCWPNRWEPGCCPAVVRTRIDREIVHGDLSHRQLTLALSVAGVFLLPLFGLPLFRLLFPKSAPCRVWAAAWNLSQVAPGIRIGSSPSVRVTQSFTSWTGSHGSRGHTAHLR